MTLYLLHYCNYFNRVIKSESTLSGYNSYVLGDPILDVNFNPADGIDTSQIVNWSYEIPDYLLVVDNTNTIVSRWFVLEAARTRAMQLQLTLKRDVIADNIEEFKRATAFIKRGYVSNSNPLIFNSEGNSFNQIKTGEVLLDNNIESPWLVLYLSRYNNEGSLMSYTGQFKASYAGGSIPEYDSLTDYPFYSFTGYHFYCEPENLVFGGNISNYESDGLLNFHIGVRGMQGTQAKQFFYDWRTNSDYPRPMGGAFVPSTGVSGYETCLSTYKSSMVQVGTTGVYESSYTGYTDVAGYNKVKGQDGKVIKAGGKYYRIYVTEGAYYNTGKVNSLFAQNAATQISAQSSIGISIKTFFKEWVPITSTSYQPVIYVNNAADTDNYIPYFLLSWKPLNDYVEDDMNYTIDLPGVITADSIYEILAAPYYDMQITYKNGTINHYGDIAIQWFQDIMSRYGAAGSAYDLQIVPYCPIDTTNWTDYQTFTLRTTSTGGPNTAICVNLTTSSFNQTIPVTLPNYNSNNKVASETQVYRIVSPNGVGEFEFNPNKNGGLTSIHVDCTLKPFNPYIQVHPVWGWLYGNSQQEDFRGLICQGDFSLPSLSNEWAAYELNNKNYREIFNRAIESQDFQRTWERRSDIVGAVSGAVGGAVAGFAFGGPGGALAGGLASAGGGITDVIAKEQIYQEQRQASIDTFNFQNGNVKARGTTLSKGTSYNIDSKYFPFIEFYTCTNEELESLQNSIKYRGMSVGVIGTIEDYLNPSDTSYIQGDLIDIDITDDFHMAREIANVLRGGIRIYA